MPSGEDGTVREFEELLADVQKEQEQLADHYRRLGRCDWMSRLDANIMLFQRERFRLQQEFS